MAYSNQSLHRIPVLNFDVQFSDNGKHTDLKSINGIHVPYDINDNIKRNEPEKQKINVRNLKYKPRRKSVSDKSLRETLSICTSYVKRLLRSSSTASSSRKYKIQRTRSRQINQIKVLFSSEARKLKNKRRNTNQELIDDIYGFNVNSCYDSLESTCTSFINIKNRQNVHRFEIPKINIKRKSKNYGTNKVNRNKLFKVNSQSSYIHDVPAHYKVVQFSNYEQTDTELQAIAKDYEIDYFQRQTEKKLGLQKGTQIDTELQATAVARNNKRDYFQRQTKKKLSLQKGTQIDTELKATAIARYNKRDYFQPQTKKKLSLQKGTQVTASSSCVSNAQRGGDDCCTISVQYSLPKEVCIKRGKPEHKSKLTKDRFQHYNSLCDTLFENVLCLSKIIFKYLLFGVALIVCFPCIITLHFCWFIAYPLRPKYKRTNPSRDSRCRRKWQICACKHVTDKSVQTREDNICSFLLKGISWAYRAGADSFGAFQSLLDSGKNKIQCYPSTSKRSGNKYRIVTSDPKKKYLLYYNRYKGWVMKSTKPRARNSNTFLFNSKQIPKRTYKPNRVKRMDDIRSPNPQCGCQANIEKYKIDNSKKTHLSDCSCHRYECLCANTSGLSVHGKLLNKKFNSKSFSRIRTNVPTNKPCKLCNKKCKWFPQRRLESRVQLKRKNSRGKGIKKKAQLVKQKSKLKFKNKIWRYLKKTKRKINTVIDDVETKVFGDTSNSSCREMYINTLRRRPWYYVCKKCPSFYPICLRTYRFCQNVCHLFLLLVAACIWCPLLMFCYLCYIIICRCL